MSSALVERVRTDPLWTAEHIYGAHLWSKQREIAVSVWQNERTAVRSCHGIGKTHVAALIGNAFLHAFPDSIVVTTAPSWTQVETLLWKEWYRVHQKAESRLEGGLGSRMTSTTCEISPTWRAFGISTDKPDRLVGQHAEHLLVIIDEAFGVSDWVLEAVRTWMTGGAMCRLLCIGNPTDPASAVARAFKSERSAWSTLHISAFDSPAVLIMPDDGTGPVLTPDDLPALGVSASDYGHLAHNFRFKRPDELEECPPEVMRSITSTPWVFDQLQSYGGNTKHPLYLVRVLGDFGQTDGVIPIAVIEAAQCRNLVPPVGHEVVIGVDVATSGDDESVIGSRIERRVRIERVRHGQDTMATTGDAVQVGSAYRSRGHKVRFVVDGIGVGAGVSDRLKELGWEVTDYKGSEKAFDPDRYANRRAETWYEGAEALKDCDLDPDDTLAADLASAKGSVNSRGQMQVEKKELTRKRLGRSPDRADAILMTYAPAPKPYAYSL